MPAKRKPGFSRRERQIMDVVYRFGQATVSQVLEQLPDPPSYSSVRALMRILEEKGHLKHREDGARYVYQPVRGRGPAGQAAMKQVLETYFDGSAPEAVAALLDAANMGLTRREVARILKILDPGGAKKR